MAKSEAKIKFTAETGDFNSQIKSANAEMAKIRAELKLNAEQMKDTGETVEGLQKKHDLLTAQLDETRKKTEAMSQKVELAKKLFGENSDEVKKLETQLIAQQTAQVKAERAVANCADEIKKQAAVMEDTTEEADDLGVELDGVEKSADKASDGFTIMKGAAANLVAEGISKVVDGLSEISKSAFVMANDTDRATNSFIAQTGLSTDAAEMFEGVMTSIYENNFGESLDDIAESMALVRNNIGNMGADELQKMTEGALTLRDTFGFEVAESTRAASALMTQFGVTGDEAYNLIAQGAQMGLNRNDDLMDVINEYSVQFADIGYSADDMFNMLVNGAGAGTWSVDKLGDSVKEFNIRMSDGSAQEAVEALGFSWEKVSAEWGKGGDSAKYVMEMLMEELSGIADTTDGYNAGVGLLGTTFEDMGYDVVRALASTNGEVDKTFGALDEINSVKYDDLGTSIEGIKRNLEMSVVEPIKNEVLPAVNEFIEDVDWEGVGETISDVFSDTIGVVKDTIGWMQEHTTTVKVLAGVVGALAVAIGLFSAATGVAAAMEAAEVTTLGALIAAKWAAFTAGMAALAPYLLIAAAIAAVVAIIVVCIKYWDEISAAVVKAAEVVWEAIKTAWDWIVNLFSSMGNWINDKVIQPIVGFFVGLWDSIVGIFQSVVDWVKSNWQSIVLFLINPFAGIFKYLWDNCEVFRNFLIGVGQWIYNNVIAPVAKFFVDLWNGIVSAFNTAWSAIVSFFTTIGQWIYDNVIAPVAQFFVDLWNGIVSAFHTVIDPWIEIVRRISVIIYEDVIQPIAQFFVDLWNDIVSGLSAAWTWMCELFLTVSTWINENVIIPVAQFFVNLWNGIVSGLSAAWTWICELALTVATWVNENVIQPVAQFFVDLWNGITNGLQAAWDFMVELFLTVAGWIDENVIQPTTQFFVDLWNSITSGVQTAVQTVKDVFATVKGWVNENVIQPVKQFFSDLWSGFTSGARKAWEGVKNVFSAVGGFFSNVFSIVKDKIVSVFQAGGEVFNNIKDGIVSVFKTVVNGIITGINSVIKLPFQGLNGILDKIHGIEIVGVKPFSWLTWRAPIPSIPLLAEGGILTQPTLNIAGEAGAEAVIPLDRLQSFIDTAVDRSLQATNLAALVYAVEDLANRAIELNINGQKFATATAADSDRVNGNRMTLSRMGLALG